MAELNRKIEGAGVKYESGGVENITTHNNFLN